ncbi:hypothetical protein TNCV_901361 [Trichonephila clavipes]|nr:hypothetical protein TNCV_901361 [Trichonephila clavipes]
MARLGLQSLPPTNLGRVDDEMIFPGRGLSQRYIDKIQRPAVFPFFSRIPIKLKSEQEFYISRKHMACISIVCLRTSPTIFWLALSLDLTPVEHLISDVQASLIFSGSRWSNSSTGTRIMSNPGGGHPSTYESLPRRITACISTRGKLAHYFILLSSSSYIF